MPKLLLHNIRYQVYHNFLFKRMDILRPSRLKKGRIRKKLNLGLFFSPRVELGTGILIDKHQQSSPAATPLAHTDSPSREYRSARLLANACLFPVVVACAEFFRLFSACTEELIRHLFIFMYIQYMFFS